jgi:hypothetical protein
VRFVTYASFIAVIIEVKYCEALPVNLAIISSSTDCPASLRAAVKASAAAALETRALPPPVVVLPLDLAAGVFLT